MLKKIAFSLVGLLVAIQIVPYGRNHSNPPVGTEPTWNSPDTKATFQRACGNCHSNETVWPWYSNVAPVSWLVKHDVDEGRSNFNVSRWGSADNAGDHAAKMVRKKRMPPWQYRIAHPEARLTDAEREQFAIGLDATFGAGSPRPSNAGDVGEKSGYSD